MSPCEHSAREALNEKVKTAISKAIEAFRAFPGALAIARNGGSELTLRSATLGFLEQTGFVAFTEGLARDPHARKRETASEKDAPARLTAKRNDIVLRCPNCRDRLAVLELKHNLAHPLQLRYLRAEREAVKTRLLQLTGGSEHPAYYYAHFVFGLECEEWSWLAAVHNSIVGDGYKAFQPQEGLAAVWNSVRGALGGNPTFGPLPVISPVDLGARAELQCWIFQVSDGQMTVLRNGEPSTC